MALAATVPGCSDDACGPSPDDTGIEIAAPGEEPAAFVAFTAGPNNDCPNPGSPTSITVAGTQTQGSGSILLCLSQPETIDGQEALSAMGPAQVVSITASLDSGCTLADVTGGSLEDLSARFVGFCDDGTHPAGFSLELDGELEMTRSCPGMDDTVTAVLSGSATVAAEGS